MRMTPPPPHAGAINGVEDFNISKSVLTLYAQLKDYPVDLGRARAAARSWRASPASN
jgi:hypothetical protein